MANKHPTIAMTCGALMASLALTSCQAPATSSSIGPDIRMSGVTAYRHEGERVEVIAEADEAVLAPDGSAATLSDGAVTLLGSQTRVAAPSVDIDLDGASAAGDEGVKIEGPGYAMTGDRYELDGEEATLSVSGSVQARDRPVAERDEPLPARPRADASSEPVSIDADHVVLHRRANNAVFTGDVVVIRGGYRLTSRKLTVTYGDDQRVTRLLAQGDVRVTEAGRVATAREAEFDTVREILTLTGDAVITEGENVIRGDKVVFDLPTDELRVERVRARVRVGDLEDAAK